MVDFPGILVGGLTRYPGDSKDGQRESRQKIGFPKVSITRAFDIRLIIGWTFTFK